MLRRLAGAVLAAIALSSTPSAAQGTQVDILFRGGTVIDGTGSAPRVADVGVRGDRIAFVGDAAKAGVTAARTIDVKGLVVSPGFVDSHTHTQADLSNAARHGNLAYLFQGVTTVVTGNDGGGPIEIARYRDEWTRNGIGTNAGLLVGFGTVRERVLKASDAKPTAAQLDQMRALVDSAMRAGALGMSTGLFYSPQKFATTEEVIELAKAAAKYGGVYDSHLRDESSYTPEKLPGAVAEALRIGKEANMAVNISHIKALGTDVWGMSDSIVAMVKRAQAAGQVVTADQYPYTASGSSVGASLLPGWAEAGGRDSLLARIADPTTHARLVAEMDANLKRRNGPAALLITGGRDRSIVGKTLEQIAQVRHESPIDAALEIIKNGGAGVASFNMNEKDIVRFMREPWVNTGSDGSDGHPRKYGTFPKKLREYVLTKHVLTLPEFVQRSSATTARAFHIPERGVLREGWFADVAVFDTATVRDLSTYEEPEKLAVGMRYVLVNGKLAIDDGKATNVMAGRFVPRGSQDESPKNDGEKRNRGGN